MSACMECGRRAQVSLCNHCTDQLGAMLIDLGWLLCQLEVTAQRKDRLTLGAARFDHPAPANFGASGLLGDVGIELQVIVSALGGPWTDVSPQQRVQWLWNRVDALARLKNPTRHFRTIARWSGAYGPSPIHEVINRPDRKFIGDCPDCGALCYARTEDVYTACPACRLPVDVEKNKVRAVIEYDLLPERALLAVLDNLGEHVPRVRFYGWVTAKKLLPLGYLSRTGVVAHKGGPKDPRVYSLNRARTLRRRELVARAN